MTPSRTRYRYVSFKILSTTHLREIQIHELIRRSILELFGAYGLSKIEPKIMDYNEGRLTGIIRCNHLYLPMLRASLASITAMGEEPIAFFILKVSGTLRALRAALQKDRNPPKGSSSRPLDRPSKP